jgi:predicted NBD/HSP70 family sugar kinase
MKHYAVGADIGGSHISAALIDMAEKKIVAGSMISLKVDNQASAGEILAVWTVALKTTMARVDRAAIAGIGIAMPGPFDYTNGIALFEGVEKYENLYGVRIGELLKQSLDIDGEMELRFMNDATAFAVGEAWMGKVTGYKRSLALTLGTGFGAAFIESGLPVLEGAEIPESGCMWHLPYKDGIADDYFSTRWFTRQYLGRTGKSLVGVKEIREEALYDKKSQELFVEFGAGLGNFLSPWIKAFGAEALVIGGNLSKAHDLFGDFLRSALSSRQIYIPVHTSDLLEDAALVGSSRLMEEGFWEKLKPLVGKM